MQGQALGEALAERGAVQVVEGVPIIRLPGGDVSIDVWPTHEPEDRQAEGIVHQRIEPVAGQPLGRVVPDLAHEVGLGVDGPHAPTELRPERGFLDVGRDIESPTVDPEACPVLD